MCWVIVTQHHRQSLTKIMSLSLKVLLGGQFKVGGPHLVRTLLLCHMAEGIMRSAREGAGRHTYSHSGLSSSSCARNPITGATLSWPHPLLIFLQRHSEISPIWIWHRDSESKSPVHVFLGEMFKPQHSTDLFFFLMKHLSRTCSAYRLWPASWNTVYPVDI